jgi:hypothetical protein
MANEIVVEQLPVSDHSATCASAFLRSDFKKGSTGISQDGGLSAAVDVADGQQ